MSKRSPGMGKMKGAPFPRVRFTPTAQYQTFFTPTDEEYCDSSHPENCVSCKYGRSTLSASLHTSLVLKDLDCANEISTSYLPVLFDVSDLVRSSNFTFILPRQGEAYSTCGTIKAIHKTLYDGCTDILYHHCDRPECPCPYCSTRLLIRDSEKAAERLTEMSRLYYIEQNIKLGWPYHWVFSQYPEIALAACDSPDSFRSGRSDAIGIFRSAGVRGGMAVPHYFRIRGESLSSDDDSDNPQEFALDGIIALLKKAGYGIGNGSKGSLWDGIYADALGLGSAYAYVVPSPHWHVHGYGFLENSRTFFQKTKWIYYKSGGPRKSEKALAASIAYTLSHATRLEVLGIPTTRAVSWFGIMAPNKGGVTEIKGSLVLKTCDHGHTYHEAAINDPSLLYDEIWTREIKKYYRLNTKTKPPPDIEPFGSTPDLVIHTSFVLDMSDLHEIEAYANGV